MNYSVSSEHSVDGNLIEHIQNELNTANKKIEQLELEIKELNKAKALDKEKIAKMRARLSEKREKIHTLQDSMVEHRIDSVISYSIDDSAQRYALVKITDAHNLFHDVRLQLVSPSATVVLLDKR